MRKHKISQQKATRMEASDCLQAVHMDCTYPLIFCHIQLTSQLDRSRLHRALQAICLVVPELLYRCDIRRRQWIDVGFKAHDLLVCCSEALASFRWDLEAGPQLRLFLVEQEEGELLVVGISHMLSDASGFKQLLYILAANYNSTVSGAEMCNNRNIKALTAQAKPFRSLGWSAGLRKGTDWSVPFLVEPGPEADACPNITVEAALFKAIHQKAKRLGCTLNDVLMTAYAHVLARMFSLEHFFLPCPVDLRPAWTEKSPLSVANMTGMCQVELRITPADSFESTLLEVSKQMMRQKEEMGSLTALRALSAIVPRIPDVIVRHILRAFYKPRLVSYTNVGIIDENRLCFDGSPIQHCHIVGAYRNLPGYQLSVSSFAGQCTLSSPLHSTWAHVQSALALLEEVSKYLVEWVALTDFSRIQDNV